MSEDLEGKLGSWADQASPVTADEARARAEAGNLVALGPDGTGAGGAPGSRRLMAAAAAIVLVGAVAIGGWVIANDGNDDPTGVDTVDQPTTTVATDPTITEVPTTAVQPTTVPEVAVSEAPNLVVVHSADHNLEVIDRTDGAAPLVLAEFDDPEAKGPNGEPAMTGRYLESVVVSPDGQTVFYGTRHLGGGEVFRIPITGGGDALDLVTYGADPAVSPDGSKLAVINTSPVEGDNGVMDAPALKIVDLADGTVREVPIDGTVDGLAHPSWSPDGSMLVLESYDDSLDVGRVVVIALHGTDEMFQGQVAVSDGTPMLPVFDADNNVVVIRQPQSPGQVSQVRAEVYRTESDTEDGGLAIWGDVMSATELEGPVSSQRTAGGGQFLLRTFADGTVRGTGSDLDLYLLDSGYLAAAW